MDTTYSTCQLSGVGTQSHTQTPSGANTHIQHLCRLLLMQAKVFLSLSHTHRTHHHLLGTHKPLHKIHTNSQRMRKTCTHTHPYNLSAGACTHKLVHTRSQSIRHIHTLTTSVSCTHILPTPLSSAHTKPTGAHTHNLPGTHTRSQLLGRLEHKHKLTARQSPRAHSPPPAEMHTRPHTLSARAGTLGLSRPAHAHSQPPLRAHPAPPHPPQAGPAPGS